VLLFACFCVESKFPRYLNDEYKNLIVDQYLATTTTTTTIIIIIKIKTQRIRRYEKRKTSTSKINCSRKTQSNSTDIWEQKLLR
jgi:hypothetical protein